MKQVGVGNWLLFNHLSTCSFGGSNGEDTGGQYGEGEEGDEGKPSG